MVFTYIGIVFIGIGIFAAFVRRKKQSELLEMKAIQVSAISDLTESCRFVSASMGMSGAFKQNVEIKGIVECQKPLFGEMSKQPCVYFEAITLERRRNPNGRMETQTVSNLTQRIPFHVRDETGTILVNPNDASIDAAEVFYRPKDDLVYTEKIVPVAFPVYVLGEATDMSGELMIQAPLKNGEPFIISVKSEEELIGATQTEIKNLLIGMIVLSIIGALLILYGLFHPPQA